MKKITLSISTVILTTLLVSCGASQKEIALQNLENQQIEYTQTAKKQQLEADGLETNSGDLLKESKESGSEAQYDKDKAEVLKSKASENLSKAASLDAEIEKAKIAAGKD